MDACCGGWSIGPSIHPEIHSDLQPPEGSQDGTLGVVVHGWCMESMLSMYIPMEYIIPLYTPLRVY